MASFHFGLWEFLPQIFARWWSGRVAVLVSGQREAQFSRLLLRIRKTGGVSLAQNVAQVVARPDQKVITGFVLDNTTRGRQRVVEFSGRGGGQRLRIRIPVLPFRLMQAMRRRAEREVFGVVPIFCYLRRGRIVVRVFPAGDEVNVVSALLRVLQETPEEWIFWGKEGAIQNEKGNGI